MTQTPGNVPGGPRWLLAAESSRARLFRIDRRHRITDELESFVEPASRLHGQDLSSDRDGRVFDSEGQGRHRMEPPTDARSAAAEAFARVLAERLDKGLMAGDFGELVITAPPHFLGLLRKALSPETASRVILDVPKNMVQCTQAEISELLHAMTV